MVEQEHSLTIDSGDRNWLHGDTTFNYNFRLNNSTEDGQGVLNKRYENIKSIEIPSIVIPNFFINIREVLCAKHRGLLFNTNGEKSTTKLQFGKLSDLNYITLKIDEIRTNQNGTNNSLNSSTAVFILDYPIAKSYNNSTCLSYSLNTTPDPDEINMYTSYNLLGKGESSVKDITLENLVYTNTSSKKIFITDQSNLSSLKISFFTPDGKPIELLNDTLSLKSVISTTIPSILYDITGNTTVTVSDFTPLDSNIRTGLYIKDYNDNTVILSINTNSFIINKPHINENKPLILESRKIELKMNEFFSSDEYRIGDRILIKSISSTTLTSESIDFLQRQEGHAIVSMYNTSDSSATNNTVYNVIEILPDFKINSNDGTITNNYFGLEDTTQIIVTDGKILNLDNQHIINMKIITKK